MKGSLKREELLALGGGGILVLVAGGLAWMGLGALGEKQAEAQALAERMGNPAMAALLADPQGNVRLQRETTEMQKLGKELEERDAALLKIWAESTEEASGTGKDWSQDPGKWKDQLILVQSRLQKEADQSRVQLGPDFYLGLEAYRQKSPPADEVPGLALHLCVAERLVQRLLEARRVAEQYPTVCEFRRLIGPGTATEKVAEPVPGSAPARPGVPPPPQERKRFRAEIQCSPEVLYEYVRLLTQDRWFFILTDVTATNSQATFPLRSEIAKKFTLPERGAGGAEKQEKKEKRLLEVLAGKESIVAMLEIDFVAWKNPEEAKPSAATPAP